MKDQFISKSKIYKKKGDFDVRIYTYMVLKS